ncbi:mucin-5AC-like [Sinocyclocheilus grahami]|uniref:mucin-5AC-like n=1 Tax=Sinocyclocheilus grahami TaxID=75366 RepID=UPI0007ACB24B|nr:PREDICTED: mucin-5AC-like [Sinocyclocheilus grahami]
MLTMRLIFSNLLLCLALGPCFKSTDAQETTIETDANIAITLPNNDTVESKLSSEITITTPENTITLLQAGTDLHNPETTLVNQVSTMLEEPAFESTPPLSTEIEQTSPESVPETTTVQTEQTTVTTPTVPVNVETIVTEQITSDAPSTSQYETTVGHTAAVAMTTDSTEALDPTSFLTESPADWSESPSIISNPVDTSTETSTTSLTSTSQLPQNTAAPVHPYSKFDEESVSTHFTLTTTSVIIEESSLPIQTSWLLIMIVCVAIIFALCVGMILFVQWRKKNGSRNFGPMYVNGQSKRSKKKKGGEDDAWAGPVNLEAGAECDAEVQDGLLPNNGKPDGDDMMLSTFAALDAGDMSNGGVGGDGTKEVKKWEEQEPLIYIDEDVTEDKTGKTLAENEKQKGDEKSEEKGTNGGETFCLTTAV